jgi:heme-degrading monooxygenase HmoA
VIVTVFRSRVRKDLDPGLLPEIAKRSGRMLELASQMPGFISYKEFQASDGEIVSIVEFSTLEQVHAWHDQPEHLEVQKWGRESVFERYHIQTCEVRRVMRFPPDEAALGTPTP